MAGKIRLIKIASEINIGKDDIVDFLRNKGFTIENKATSMLTEEMVNAVEERFKKEKRAAETQRIKIEQHKQIQKSSQVAAKKTDATAKKKTVKAKVETEPAQKIKVITDQSDTKVKVETTESTAQVEKTEEVKPAQVNPAPANSAPAGNVQAPKEVQEPITPKKEVSPVPSVAPVPIAVVSETKTEILTPAPAQAEVSQTQGEQAPKEQTSNPEQRTSVPQGQRNYTQNGDKPRSQQNDRPRNDAQTALDAEARKKKKRKKIAEVDINTASTTPKIQGLTIVGKIDLRKPEPSSRSSKNKPARREGGNAPAAQSTSTRPQRPPRDRNNNTGNQQNQPKQNPSFNQDNRNNSPKDKAKDLSENGPKNKKIKKGMKLPTKDASGPKFDKKKRKRVSVRDMISNEDVDKAIKMTLSEMEDTATSSSRSKFRMKKKAEREEKDMMRREEAEKESKVLHLTEFVTTADLAKMIDVSANEIILKCIGLGLMVSINQRLDKDTISLIADDYGLDVEFVDDKDVQKIDDTVDDDSQLSPRSPIVTIMGHVDHGKTSLLDYIRNANVVAGEAGGITQHIGAYRVKLPNDKYITFLDTPGHEAFTAMRARGAQVTDIVILVVAADDSVMPQTIEAISHSLAANVPIIVAINKIDKPDAQPDRIKQQLADHGVLVEEWGGKYQCVEISAKKGMNIDVLLEKVLLEAEMLDLKANSERSARCTVIEANMTKGFGSVCTVIVQKGTLNIGDPFVVGDQHGKVRTMLDERGNKMTSAKPSIPARVIGLNGLPEAGDVLMVVDSEVDARNIANERRQLRRQQEFKHTKQVTLSELSKKIHEGEIKDLSLIIKGDVGGSVEALSDSLFRLSNDEVRVNIIHKGVGTISESDVMLAVASKAIIIGFQVSPTAHARKLADAENVDIRQYSIIYDCIDEVKKALEGLLAPELKEDILAEIDVRRLFKISHIGVIAGCQVLSGKIHRNDRVRVMRDGLPIFTGTINSLKRNKDDVKEVDSGYECGISLEGFNDLQESDKIVAFKVLEVKRTLS